MSNLQFVLTTAIPSLLVLIGIFLSNARFNGIDPRFNGIEARMASMEGDLRQFYLDLGRHEADIVNIKERNRSKLQRKSLSNRMPFGACFPSPLLFESSPSIIQPSF